MRKRKEVICILTDRNCENISDPYPGYESQDTGIYQIMNLLAPIQVYFRTVDLSFRVSTIGEFRCKRRASTEGDAARPGANRSITRLDLFALLSESDK